MFTVAFMFNGMGGFTSLVAQEMVVLVPLAA
jgi:hypothetical protein